MIIRQADLESQLIQTVRDLAEEFSYTQAQVIEIVEETYKDMLAETTRQVYGFRKENG